MSEQNELSEQDTFSEQPPLKEVTCNGCGWVHMQVTRDHAVNEVMRFNAYFDTLTKAEQESNYGGKGATMHLYEHCFLCGGPYTNFRDAKSGDYPDGCTIGPIIDRND